MTKKSKFSVIFVHFRRKLSFITKYAWNCIVCWQAFTNIFVLKKYFKLSKRPKNKISTKNTHIHYT